MISSFLICNISDEIGNLKAKIRNNCDITKGFGIFYVKKHIIWLFLSKKSALLQLCFSPFWTLRPPFKRSVPRFEPHVGLNGHTDSLRKHYSLYLCKRKRNQASPRGDEEI
jgi:hypothetical protein